MKKLIMTKGLPASGKTTWAKDQRGFVRVNKDDLREMLHGGETRGNSEKRVLNIRDYIITNSLKNGKSIIVDDTNFAPWHEERLREIAKECEAVFEIKDFTHVPVNKCLERDALRKKPVGRKVIVGMYEQYLKREVPQRIQDNNLPRAIMVDIDGTLAKMNGRGPFDWMRVGEDIVNEAVRTVVLAMNKMGRAIIVVSGRDSVCRDITKEWLDRNMIPHNSLFMRPEGNCEKDSIIKRRIFDTEIDGKYNVDFVLDDRNQVVEMWRELGLVCMQVAPGDF